MQCHTTLDAIPLIQTFMTPLGRFRTLVLVAKTFSFFSYSSLLLFFFFFFYTLLQLSDLLLFFPLIFNLYLLFHPFVPFPIFSFSFIITPLFPFLFCSIFCRQFLLFPWSLLHPLHLSNVFPSLFYSILQCMFVI